MADNGAKDNKRQSSRELASKRDETDGAIGHYSWRQITRANHATGGAEADE